MNCWLITIVYVNIIVISQCNSEWRHLYIKPGDNASQEQCPVEHCYSLQDVINNQSYFFDTYTLLELMPGRYDITERVGQLVIANVSHFTLKGSLIQSKPNTTIHCQQNATFGFTFTNTVDVTILNIQIVYCCAQLTTNITIDDTKIEDFVTFKIDSFIKQWFSAYQGSCHEQNHFPCCSSIASINNVRIVLSQTIVFHSKGVGILILQYATLHVSNSLMAYNKINCIIYASNDLMNTSTIISDTKIAFGWGDSFNLASGLNLVLRSISVRKQFDIVTLTNVIFTNNIKFHGNLYLLIYRGPECKFVTIYILINEIKVTSETATAGITIDYIVFDRYPSRFYWTKYNEHWTTCTKPGQNIKPVTVEIQRSYFEGSCILVQNVRNAANEFFNFTPSNVKINASMCPTALVLNKTVSRALFDNLLIPIDSVFTTVTLLQIKDITITKSYNIMLICGLETTPIQVQFTGNTLFTKNQGSIVVTKGTIKFQGNTQISSNHANEYESIFLMKESCKVSLLGNTTFMNNRGRQGGAISAHNSRITFQGRARFIGNVAETVGGGVSLKEGSKMFLNNATNISYYKNEAKEYGGGIYVEEILLLEQKKAIKCFIGNVETYENMVTFESNTAGLAGAALFGGWIDICIPDKHSATPPTFLTFIRSYSAGYIGVNSDISSSASRICICENSRPITDGNSVSIQTFPGKVFEIEAVAVGQRFGVVPAIVKAEFLRYDRNKNIITELQQLQNVGKTCTILRYTVRSRNNNETMHLAVDRQHIPEPDPSLEIDILQFQQLHVIIYLNNCPLGFSFDSNRNICVCDYSLEKQGIQCNISSQTVLRNAQKWISALQVHGITVSHHCPYDYCKSYDLSLNLSTPNDQCAFSRSGILCGTCQPGHSMVLGTSNCKQCSDTWLLLLLPFSLAGVTLVTCLMVLNLTVSTGTINGLIFYANIVRANNAIFFPGRNANIFLSWFIAWLNLDLGFETCFCDGLTAYSKTWLQFVFPVYIWILVSAIIISSHYSIRAAKICGNNAVQVLTTLFFLSYAKLLRVTIAVFQPTRLIILGDSLNRIKVVWNYNGNLEYLSGRHIPLFVITLLFFIMFFVPYTLALFGIQWLQPISHYKALFWVSRLKPLFDAYTGPYKDRHRYWTGLLLLLRICLFCVFAANTTGDPAINLLVTIIVIVCLFVYLGLLGGVYKNWPLNLLEYVFFLKIVVLSAGTLYTIAVEKSVYPVTQFSVGTTLVITIVIVLYHGIQLLVKRCYVKDRIWALKCTINGKRSNKDIDVQQLEFEEHPNMTYSVVGMEDMLLHH